MARPIVAEVDLAAIAANLGRARRYAPSTEVLAVVKANAYGHGLERVLPALVAADGLALIELDAALALRATGYARPILLLEGFFDAGELDHIAAQRLRVVVHDIEQVRMLELARLARGVDVYVKANTGMNRLGFAPADVAPMCARLAHAASIGTIRLNIGRARSTPDSIPDR